MVVSYVVRPGRDLVSLIGHQDRVDVLELGVEQTIEGISELNGRPRARATFSHAHPHARRSASEPA